MCLLECVQKYEDDAFINPLVFMIIYEHSLQEIGTENHQYVFVST